MECIKPQLNGTNQTKTMVDEGACGIACGSGGGWIAAAIAALCYGSYGVPIKATMDVDVHPLVLQTYKTIVLFLTSWLLVILTEGEERVRFTPWGVLSGFLWVTGGTGGIYGIRNAGIAIAVGTWASVMVVVNFVWGILIFHEPVHSFFETIFAFIVLGMGLVGMSKYSAASADRHHHHVDISSNDGEPDFLLLEETLARGDGGISSCTDGENDENNTTHNRLLTTRRKNANDDEEPVVAVEDVDQDGEQEGYEELIRRREEAKPLEPEDKKVYLSLCSTRLGATKRQLGIAFAVWNGLFGGSSLLPLHYAKAQGFGGLAYIPSFAVGSLISNVLIWFVYFVCNCVVVQRQQHTHQQNSPDDASHGGLCAQSIRSMPSWHFKQLWLRGFLAGLLLSVGMFGSIVATTYLGQGVGNSLVQTKILISGLWGICWYKEIKDPRAISKWFASAFMCVVSILLLSYERLAVTETSPPGSSTS